MATRRRTKAAQITSPAPTPERPIEWDTTTLTLERCAQILGSQPADLFAQTRDPAGVGHFACRAAGAWDSNDREKYAVYNSLLEYAKLQKYCRSLHAAHYETHPNMVVFGHDLEVWEAPGPAGVPTRPRRAHPDAEYHVGYVDEFGRQWWVYTHVAPLTPKADCHRCQAHGLVPNKENVTP